MRKKKGSFVQIADGEFARMFQEDFEKAQAIAEERGQPVKVIATIEVIPPKKGDRFGGVGYGVEMKIPKRQSIPAAAEWDGSHIVSTGRDIGEIVNTELDLDNVPPRTVPFAKGGE